jgi:mRNA interferase MazF
MVAPAAPDRGDIVMMQFNQQAGREQAGRRPAFVITPRSYNAKVGLMLACPITNKEKGYPFEVPLPSFLKTSGVILADHVKSLDWHVRGAEFIEKSPKDTTAQVLQKLGLLIT